MKKILLVIAIIGAVHHFKNNPNGFSFSSGHDEVILYATDWCGYCQQTRVFFSENGILYTEYNIERSAYGKAEYDKVARGRGVPVVDARGTIVQGYNPPKLRKALGI